MTESSSINLPENLEELNNMKKNIVFKRENPSNNYYIVNRIAVGGFARIFHVKKHKEETSYALKFMEPKNP